MKRNLLVILTLMAIYCCGCKKGSDVTIPKPNTFFPIVTGSTWTYIDLQEGLSADTVTNKITGGTATINGLSFYNVATASTNKGQGTDYFYNGNHVSILHALNAYADTIIDLQLYNDTATVGYSSVGIPTARGLIDNLPVRTINTIIAKDIPLTVNGVKYTDVVHSRAYFQYDYRTGNGFQTNFIYDFYLAKNIGLIAYSLDIDGNVAEQEVLIKYTP